MAHHPDDAGHQQLGEVPDRLVPGGEGLAGARRRSCWSGLLRARESKSAFAYGVGRVHERAATARDQVQLRVPPRRGIGHVLLEVVHVAADRGQVPVLRPVDQIPDRVADAVLRLSGRPSTAAAWR